MGDPTKNCQICAGNQYVALLEVSEAIVAHRDLPSLFHDLADRLRRVAQFDYLSLVLHDAATNTMRLHVVEPSQPASALSMFVLPMEDDPAGLVWKSQQPLITSHLHDLRRWPRLLELVEQYGVQSYCWLPLSTARRRLGTLVLTSKEPCNYDTVDVCFLQRVANQVAVAVENALAFQELAAIKDQLAKENAYLVEEVRTELSSQMVAVSASLRGALKKVETVAPTDSTGAHLRRNRHRQGVGCPRASRPQPAPRANVRQNELRGDSHGPFGE